MLEKIPKTHANNSNNNKYVVGGSTEVANGLVLINHTASHDIMLWKKV